jgi:4-hydroxy-3-polyprenylbenzoate decarboxylase
MPHSTHPKRIIVDVSGASGAVYGVRLLQMLRELGQVQTHLTVSDGGWINLQQELSLARAEVRPTRRAGAV